MGHGPEPEQPRGAEERPQFVAPQPPRREPETTSGAQARSGGDGQVVFDEVAVLQQQLAEAQAELDRQRALRRARKKRWEERHPEQARRKHAEEERARYARRRQSAC